MENNDLKTFLKKFEETLRKNNIKRCSKEEFERYEHLFKQHDRKCKMRFKNIFISELLMLHSLIQLMNLGGMYIQLS